MKRLWLIGLAALLGSCTQPSALIKARIVGDSVVFEAFRGGGWFEKERQVSLLTDRFTVYSREGAVWVIERNPECLPPGRTTFPLTYGRLPACYIARLPAKPLKNNVVYAVEAGDTWDGRGDFRLVLTAEAVDYNGQEMSNWPPETHPNKTYPKIYPPSDSSDPENSVETNAAGNAAAGE